MLKKEYKDISDFMDAIHSEIKIKDYLIDTGIVNEDDFKGKFISCPFHDGDHDPSLYIDDSWFKCYGCDTKGDLVKFLCEFYNIDFLQGVKKLADTYNIKINELKFNYDKKYDSLKLEWDKYIKDMETAPEEAKKLKRMFFPQQIGYDKKINYVVMPLTSKTGAILGFTKRRVNDNITVIKLSNGKEMNRPKWQHSNMRDSLMGQCHNIFNLENAASEIKKKRKVIITEGPKDVIAYRRINLNFTICVCGTSNSNNIWDLILPVDEIILSFDNDNAGIKATISTILYLCHDFDIKNINCIMLPKGLDPYDCLTINGNNALIDKYENRINAADFMVKYSDLQNVYDMYQKVPDFNKMYVMKSICKNKMYSITEAESWLDSNNESKIIETKENNEKEQLLEIVHGKGDYKILDSDFKKSIEKAQRILLLKYGIEVEV